MSSNFSNDGSNHSSGPLDGVRVIGLEQSVAAPMCTRILGDLGASVLKVERPGEGDFARHWDGNAAGESAQFWWLNRRKSSIALNLKDSAAKELFDELLENADVLVHNMSPAAAGRLDLSSQLNERFPHLVNCQISGYGNDTALKDRKSYDMLVQAEAGIMSLTGTPEQPSRVGVSLCDVATGFYAVISILAALIEKRSTGAGRHLDVAMFDVGLEFVGPMLVSYMNAGLEYDRIPDRHHAIVPYGVFGCADDSKIVVAVEQDEEWRRFCRDILGDEELAKDPRYATNLARVENRKEVEEMVGRALGRMEYSRAAQALAAGNFAFASVNSMKDLADHPVTRDRDIVSQEVSSSGAPVEALVGMAGRLFENGSAQRGRPPDLDEHAGALAGFLRDGTTTGGE